MTNSAHYTGHRQRLKERILAGGGFLADYELLEALLFLAHARIDTKPIAKDLLKKFSSLTHVFLASPEELMSVKGVGEASVSILKLMLRVSQRLGQDTIHQRFSIGNLDSLVRYCRLCLHDPKIEQFHLLFLDGHHQVIAEEVHQIGTIDQTAVYPREVIKKALSVGASWLILVHNHPSGHSTPSQEDIDLTRYIMEAGSRLGILVYDHIVLTTSSYTSMRQTGQLPQRV